MRKIFLFLFCFIVSMPVMAYRFVGTVDKEPVAVDLFYDKDGARCQDVEGSVIFTNVSNTPLYLTGTVMVYGREDTGYAGYPIFSLEEYLPNGKYYGNWELRTSGKSVTGTVTLTNGKKLKVILRRVR